MMKNKVKTVLFAATMLALGFIGGFTVDELISAAEKTTHEETAQIEQTGKAELKVVYHDNPQVVDMVLVKQIAPDFHVGFGLIGGDYEMFMDDPEWDPLGIGVDEALALTRRIREVDGVDEDVYAEGYELTFHVAKSHLGRRDEIVEEVKGIIQDFDASLLTVSKE